MNDILLTSKIKSYEKDYRAFMKIDSFPNYLLEQKTVSLETAESQGFESLASAQYDFNNFKHKIIVSNNIPIKRYLVFHEFTHILDAEMYSSNNKQRYSGISGYTEYHASQIELLELLGANSVEDTISFSNSTIINTVSGEKTVLQYMSEKHQHALSLFGRKDFPSSIEVLKSALGVLFNYWGIRSICKMYSTDYSLNENNQPFLTTIPHDVFVIFNNMMNGWVDNSKIELSIKLYLGVICSLAKEFNLI